MCLLTIKLTWNSLKNMCTHTCLQVHENVYACNMGVEVKWSISWLFSILVYRHTVYHWTRTSDQNSSGALLSLPLLTEVTDAHYKTRFYIGAGMIFCPWFLNCKHFTHCYVFSSLSWHSLLIMYIIILSHDFGLSKKTVYYSTTWKERVLWY